MPRNTFAIFGLIITVPASWGTCRVLDRAKNDEEHHDDRRA